MYLKTGESFVISPDEPHVYISGDLMEAMVSSDNVVRGGLTPKLKDTATLTDVRSLLIVFYSLTCYLLSRC
jgi:mannose-6-phosphate isomerase